MRYDELRSDKMRWVEKLQIFMGDERRLVRD